MSKRIRLVGILLLMLLAWVVPAQAVTTGTVTFPAEGATVKSPVLFEFRPDVSERSYAHLEVARGKNATSGFIRAKIGQRLRPGSTVIEAMWWDAEGFNPGIYTMRFVAVHPETEEVLSQAVRTVVLEGPDYSPKVSLAAHGTLGGQSMVSGSVEDADLAGWRLEALDNLGTATLLTEGTSGGAFPVLVDVGALKDGAYTLRLTAVDRLGQEAVAEQKVQIKNPGPAVQVGLVVVDPVGTVVPITYTASSDVSVHVDVIGPGGMAVASGDANGKKDGTANVPVSFRGLAAGTYAAVATVKDQQNRVGSDTFNILVREGAPAATLEAPAVAEGEYFVRVILPQGVDITRMEVHVRSESGTDIQRFPTLPSSSSFSLAENPRGEGKTAYRVVLYLPGGRVSESEEAVVITDYQAPRMGKVSVAPIDGQGLNLRWDEATDTVGLKGYEVVMIEGTTERVLATLPPDQLSYMEGLPEGEYKAVVVAVDLAGHRSSSDLLTFRVQAGAVSLMRNGIFLPTDTAGFTEDGRTWVPLRLFGEAMGYKVSWDQGRQAATIVDAARGLTMVATVGDTRLQMTGPEGAYTLELPAAPRLVGSRVLVPLRAMVEAFGAKVAWHGEIWTVELLVD